MRRPLHMGLVAAALAVCADAQPLPQSLPTTPAGAALQAKPARPAASRAPSPLASQFRAQKLVIEKDGKESLEDASNVQIGDTVQYSVRHKNVSQRRLLQVDFGIPIPPGTSYVEGSANPEGARRMALDKRREQMQWRVEKLEPGDAVTLSLRVRIDPDPMLTPTAPEAARPELRR